MSRLSTYCFENDEEVDIEVRSTHKFGSPVGRDRDHCFGRGRIYVEGTGGQERTGKMDKLGVFLI